MTGETKIAIFADTPTTMSRNPDNRKRAPIPVPEPAPLPDPETIDIEGIFNEYVDGGIDLVVVLGPTASGKTRYAVALAKRFRELGRPAEILSADSRQVYCGMDIGTGKDLCEYEDVPYHLIDIVDAGSRFDLYQWQEAFEVAYKDIRERGAIPVLCGGTGLYIQAATCGYSLPQAPPDPELRAKSIALFQEEASRLEALGLDVINIHPGAFKEGDRTDGIRRCAAALDEVLSAHPTVRIAVENTAGAGTILSSTFEELDMILSEVKASDRVGFTLDTAHLFGSGYNVRDDVNKVLDEFFSRFSPEKLYGMHLNDSKVPLDSNKDRHDSIGLGLIGEECFKAIVRRKEVRGIPLILETPDETRWAEEIKMLLSIA